ncbi:hypothetical protein DPSP01_004571 [Paraphaeosphaeria sporulosa]
MIIRQLDLIEKTRYLDLAQLPIFQAAGPARNLETPERSDAYGDHSMPSTPNQEMNRPVTFATATIGTQNGTLNNSVAHFNHGAEFNPAFGANHRITNSQNVKSVQIGAVSGGSLNQSQARYSNESYSKASVYAYTRSPQAASQAYPIDQFHSPRRTPTVAQMEADMNFAQYQQQPPRYTPLPGNDLDGYGSYRPDAPVS